MERKKRTDDSRWSEGEKRRKMERKKSSGVNERQSNPKKREREREKREENRWKRDGLARWMKAGFSAVERSGVGQTLGLCRVGQNRMIMVEEENKEKKRKVEK